MDRQNAFLAGASIGLTIAAPVGPMALLCIRRTLSAGLRAGISTGAGASTLHLAYTAIVLAGVNHVADWLAVNHRVFDLASMIVLLYFARRCLLREPPGRPTPLRGAAMPTLARNYGSAIAFGSLNPMLPILLLSAVAAAVGTEAPYRMDAILLLGGVFVGSFGWWCALSGAIAAVGRQLGPRLIRLLDVVGSASLCVLAALSLRRLLV